MASKVLPTADYGGAPIGATVMMVPMNQLNSPTQDIFASRYGRHAALQTITYGEIKVLYRAEFDYYCCTCLSNPLLGSCCIDGSRFYFHVQENAYETNFPMMSFQCCALISSDWISKSYFDRGIFNQQGFLRAIGCTRGKPTVHPGNIQLVCCCKDCPSGCNDCQSCYCSAYCGDRVRVLPAEYFCCCCPTRANFLCNYCGLCGPKSGEPLMLRPFLGSLKIGTGEQLVVELENARANWSARTGLK